jgi:DNA uptake protein ComE-like DNA-binding protein
MSAGRLARSHAVAERAALSGALLLLTAALAGVPGNGPPNGARPVIERAALRLDPNNASRAELMLLPGVGEARADAIIAEREPRVGENAFQSLADVNRIRGIGPRRIEQLRPHLHLPQPSNEQP